MAGPHASPRGSARFYCDSHRAGPAAYDGTMQNEYTAVVRQDGEWWIGWIEEIPGVNSQGKSREELTSNLRSALEEILEMNRDEARKAAGDDFEEVRISA